MFDGSLIVDLETKRLVRVNASLCRMLGYAEAELLAMSVMDIHPAEEIPGILEKIQARAEGRYHGHVVPPRAAEGRQHLLCRYRQHAGEIQRPPLHRRVLPRRQRPEAGRGRAEEGTSQSPPPAPVERP